eukprot:TRINITY_DN6511_c0_g1_i2.p1 TRINITY_DN6511_c0_g1~~TRINITY_DN6511_c0_g1_i2.p1  ORF type:complete len:110 (+),score=15.55 TRINITY_DN6511_c0_g1_i2:91-420(+)
MGEEIWIYRAGREDVHIPTDCEGPIGAGMIVGDWQVTSGYSRFGGNICSYRPDQYDGALNERDEGRTVRGEQEGASPIQLTRMMTEGVGRVEPLELREKSFTKPKRIQP